LLINVVLHLIRIVISYLIMKDANKFVATTSFRKDWGWQILSLFFIIGYILFV